MVNDRLKIRFTSQQKHVISTMSDFLVGWVELAKSELLNTNLFTLTDYLWIAKSLNPTPNSHCQAIHNYKLML